MTMIDKRRPSLMVPPPMGTTQEVSLSSVPRGTPVRLTRLMGGHPFLSRLASLGFTPGARLQVVQNYGRGPLIVRLRDTRVALGRGEADKILVEQIAGVEDGA
jgi:ferrous iron transport protein A